MNKIALSLFFLILAVRGFSNEGIQKAFKSKKDSDKVSFFRSLSNEEKVEDIYFFQSEFSTLVKQNSNNYATKKQFLFALGLIDQIQNKNLEAISKFNELLNFKNYNLSERETMDIYVALQECYLKLNLYSKVFDSNKKINTLISNGVDYPLWSYNIQSRLYLQLQQYDKAISQLKSEINLLYKNPKRDSLIIPSAYNDLGYYYHLKKDYNNALSYYNKAIQTATKGLKTTNPFAYKSVLLSSKSNIANLHLDRNEYGKTISVINKDILPKIESKNTPIYIQSYLMLGEAYLKTNKLNETKSIIETLEKICCFNEVKLKIQLLELQSSYYEKKEDFKASLKYTSEIKHLKDSLLSVQNLNLLKSTELNYFIENKEKEVTAKNQIIEEKEKTNLIIIIIGLIALLTTSFFAFQNNRRKRLEIEKMNASISKKNEEIKLSLHEKELLLKEIHHRVKNNLQIISGILSLQNNSISDEKAKQILVDGQDRIQTIALLHKTMYQNENFNMVSFQTYSNELITYIKQANITANKNITIHQEIEDVQFNIDTAIPLSLIINEIITNCYKHAFENKPEGSISISIKKQTDGYYELSIEDNGKGLPENFNSFENYKSVGFDLIHGLCQQIEGEIEITNENGTKITIQFKEQK
jgi:two-component sensor histidine kinase/tetratricopeptide (TPR) repeat protein